MEPFHPPGTGLAAPTVPAKCMSTRAITLVLEHCHPLGLSSFSQLAPACLCRRDLAVLLLHAGRPAAAAAELSAYLDSVRTRKGGSSSGLEQNPFDVRLAQDLWKMISESGVKPAR